MSGNDTSGGEEGGVGGEVSNEQHQQQQQQQLGEKRSEQSGEDSSVDSNSEKLEDTSQKVKCSDGEKSTGKTPGGSKKEKAQQSRFGFLRRHHTDSPKKSK